MAWFQEDPEKIQNIEEFIKKAIKECSKYKPSLIGLSLQCYIKEIKNKTTKEKFISTIKMMLKNKKTEKRIKDALQELKQFLNNKL